MIYYYKETKHRIYINICETTKLQELKLDPDCEVVLQTSKTVHIFSRLQSDLVNISFIKSPHIIFNTNHHIRYIITYEQLEIRFLNNGIHEELEKCLYQKGKLLKDDTFIRSYTYQLPEYDNRFLISGDLLPSPILVKSARNI
jgi:hypothetical protein